MELIDRVLNYLHERRERNVRGDINCIPSPFEGFRSEFVGIEKERYYILTGNQKSAKSQFTSFMFIFHPLIYAYQHSDKLRVKIFYAPLEESPDQAIMRFIRFILFKYSNQTIRVDPQLLESTVEKKALPQEILDLLEQSPYKELLEFYESHVEFVGEKNPTGIYKRLIKYAVEHGTREQTEIIVKDEFGQETRRKVFKSYTPNDPDEYVIIILDHCGLLGLESGMTLRDTIKKMSNYFMELRDYYKYIPVMVQQQSVENQSLDAFKLTRIRPTPSGLADCKDTRYDCSVMLGLSNPYAMEVKNFLGYDIMKLKDHQRFFEVMLSRFGAMNSIKALYFDGAVSYFDELCAPMDTTFLERVYRYINTLKEEKQREIPVENSFLIFSKIIRKLRGKIK